MGKTIPAFEVLAKALLQEGCSNVFFLTGGPMSEISAAGHTLGLRVLDVRHEQAATVMAQGYSRISAKPGVAITASGPGTVNGASGLLNAFMDCVPVVLLGGSSPITKREHGVFQELDQVALLRPFTKWAGQVVDPYRIPDMVHLAFLHATSGRPGPVYLDCPGDVIHAPVDETLIEWSTSSPPSTITLGDPAYVKKAVALLEKAQRPLIVVGSGLLWSRADKAFREVVERLQIPFYTTPQARGVIPDDHALSMPEARSVAFREADVVLVLGTRDNYVFGHFRSPRFAKDVKLISVNAERSDIGRARPVEIGITGDVGAVLQQLMAELETQEIRLRTQAWIERLSSYARERAPKNEERMSTDQVPIHPLRLCKEIRDFKDRDAILAVDGQEILNFARQSIPIYAPHSLTSGTAGWMGVGVPLGIGGKAAKPDKQTIILTGDGAFGLNGIEIDTAIRHKLPVTIVISNNGGWTAGREGLRSIGRELGQPDYEKIAHAFGGYGERVERPDDIRPALERAKASGTSAIINVITDPKASATTAKFADYEYA